MEFQLFGEAKKGGKCQFTNGKQMAAPDTFVLTAASCVYLCIFVYLCVFVYFCVFVCLFKFQKWKADESGHFCLQSHSRAAFKSRLLETRKTKAASS